MKKEKKEQVHYLGKDAFLLGRRKDDNAKIYLEKASWDCGWYWGFGYLEIYNKPKTDIKEHYHFESLLEGFGIDGIQKHFRSFVLNEKEMWILADLMKSYQTLKETAGYYHLGNSNYADEGLKQKDLKMWKKINKDIRKIANEVEKLLSEK